MIGSNISEPSILVEEVDRIQPRAMFATDFTVREAADSLNWHANMDTCAKDVVRPDMGSQRVVKEIEGETFGMRPRYL